MLDSVDVGESSLASYVGVAPDDLLEAHRVVALEEEPLLDLEGGGANLLDFPEDLPVREILP